LIDSGRYGSSATLAKIILCSYQESHLPGSGRTVLTIRCLPGTCQRNSKLPAMSWITHRWATPMTRIL